MNRVHTDNPDQKIHFLLVRREMSLDGDKPDITEGFQDRKVDIEHIPIIKVQTSNLATFNIDRTNIPVLRIFDAPI